MHSFTLNTADIDNSSRSIRPVIYFPHKPHACTTFLKTITVRSLTGIVNLTSLNSRRLTDVNFMYQNQTVLVRRNSFVLQDLGLHVFNRIRRLDLERKYLNTIAQAKHLVESRLLLDAVVEECMGVAIGGDGALMVQRDIVLVFNLVVFICDLVRRLDLERNYSTCLLFTKICRSLSRRSTRGGDAIYDRFHFIFSLLTVPPATRLR